MGIERILVYIALALAGGYVVREVVVSRRISSSMTYEIIPPSKTIVTRSDDGRKMRFAAPVQPMVSRMSTPPAGRKKDCGCLL